MQNTGKAGPLPRYGSFISRIFPSHGKHFQTIELDKAMEIGLYTNLVFTIFRKYFNSVELRGPIYLVKSQTRT